MTTGRNVFINRIILMLLRTIWVLKWQHYKLQSKSVFCNTLWSFSTIYFFKTNRPFNWSSELFVQQKSFLLFFFSSPTIQCITITSLLVKGQSNRWTDSTKLQKFFNTERHLKIFWKTWCFIFSMIPRKKLIFNIFLLILFIESEMLSDRVAIGPFLNDLP